MKYTSWKMVLTRWLSCSLLAGTVPLAAVAEEPPSPPVDQEATDYMPVAQRYLQALSEGRFEDALAMIDYEGMSDYLIQGRLTELRRTQPAMTPDDEKLLIAGFRQKEVSDARMREVVLEMMEQQDPEGMTWRFKQTARSEKVPDGVILTYEMNRTGKPVKTAPLGLRKTGSAWRVAPYLLEIVMQPVKAETMVAPEDARLFCDQYWSRWRDGEMDRAYESFGATMKQQVSLLNYLETTRKVLEEYGVLTSWKQIEAYKFPHEQISMPFDLTFTKKNARAVLVVKKESGAWTITGFQFLKGDKPAPQ